MVVQPRSFITRGLIAASAMIAAAAIATRWVKVSLHVAFNAFAATALIPAAIAGWVLLALVPLVAWSRLFLARHTFAEVAGGAAIGFAAALLLHS
jgi:membrane-associated phospholipid phosphatase